MTVLLYGVFTGGLVVLVGGPMWAGWVRRGPLWGVRTTLAFQSEENWDRLNRPAGRVLVGWGVVHLAVGGALSLVFGPGMVIPKMAGVGAGRPEYWDANPPSQVPRQVAPRVINRRGAG